MPARSHCFGGIFRGDGNNRCRRLSERKAVIQVIVFVVLIKRKPSRTGLGPRGSVRGEMETAGFRQGIVPPCVGLGPIQKNAAVLQFFCSAAAGDRAREGQRTLRGKSILTRNPPKGLWSKAKDPPQASTISRTIPSPRPCPSTCSSSREPRSSTCRRWLSGMPGPSSSTHT
ncbi:hypothetical protein D3C79_727760 [compost metagenome]